MPSMRSTTGRLRTRTRNKLLVLSSDAWMIQVTEQVHALCNIGSADLRPHILC